MSFFSLSPDELSALSDEKIDELSHRMEFVRLAMPGSWLDYADELKRAAEYLWAGKDNQLRVEVLSLAEEVDGLVKYREVLSRYYSVSRPYILLAGFALENLLKGILIARDPSHITSGSLSRSLRSHKITELVRKVGSIELDAGERRFCEVAESAIPYWGRYPIPLTQNRVMREVGMDDEMRNSFLRLYQRLSGILFNDIREGWDSGVGAKCTYVRYVEENED